MPKKKGGYYWQIIVVVGLLASSACGCGHRDERDTVDSSDSLASKEGQIAFTRLTKSPDGEKGADIYVMEADGTNQERLTSAPGFEGFPAWSADGERIAFVSTHKGGGWNIYVMNADGTGQTRLTEGGAAWPSW